MAQKYLGGVAEVAINESLIPAELLSEVSVEITEGTRDTDTLAGKFTQPTGMFDTAQAAFTMYLPSMDYLKVLFPDLHNAGSGARINEGNLILNAGDCFTTGTTPVNIHYVCDGDIDTNDVYIYNGLVQLNIALTFNNSDSLSVEVTIFAQPDDDGNVVRFGAGNLTADSHFDYATMSVVS